MNHLTEVKTLYILKNKKNLNHSFMKLTRHNILIIATMYFPINSLKIDISIDSKFKMWCYLYLDCIKPCPKILKPVCATDNKTFDNECLLGIESCKTNGGVTVAHEGICQKGMF